MLGIGKLSPEQLANSRSMLKLFSQISSCYDRINRVISLGQDRRWRRQAVGLLYDIPEGPVLDLATGTGELALELSSLEREVIGCDLTLEMLGWAKAKVERYGNRRIALVRANAFLLPFPDRTFAGVTIGFALRDLLPLPDLFREVFRVLRKRGKVVCLELTRPRSGFLWSIYKPYLFGFIPFIGMCLGGKGRAYSYLPRSLLHLPLPSELDRIMQRVGFSGIGHRVLAFNTITIHWGYRSEAKA